MDVQKAIKFIAILQDQLQKADMELKHNGYSDKLMHELCVLKRDIDSLISVCEDSYSNI
ncbi:hypothetical protein [Romboutsia ilealis]|uniref:hypothetical protein n=1 Tax=Romboutsia ilealis TaxID=1115758 RepID=UPI0026F37F2D|nr:hypothetical protein [Romboutsia ilealis]